MTPEQLTALEKVLKDTLSANSAASKLSDESIKAIAERVAAGLKPPETQNQKGPDIEAIVKKALSDMGIGTGKAPEKVPEKAPETNTDLVKAQADLAKAQADLFRMQREAEITPLLNGIHSAADRREAAGRYIEWAKTTEKPDPSKWVADNRDTHWFRGMTRSTGTQGRTPPTPGKNAQGGTQGGAGGGAQNNTQGGTQGGAGGKGAPAPYESPAALVSALRAAVTNPQAVAPAGLETLSARALATVEGVGDESP
jgi:hypothetical protein